jgi:hypothetical protein
MCAHPGTLALQEYNNTNMVLGGGEARQDELPIPAYVPAFNLLAHKRASKCKLHTALVRKVVR